MTTYDVAQASGMEHDLVIARTNKLHQMRLVRLVKNVECHPDLRAKSGPYWVGLFERA